MVWLFWSIFIKFLDLGWLRFFKSIQATNFIILDKVDLKQAGDEVERLEAELQVWRQEEAITEDTEVRLKVGVF